MIYSNFQVYHSQVTKSLRQRITSGGPEGCRRECMMRGTLASNACYFESTSRYALATAKGPTSQHLTIPSNSEGKFTSMGLQMDMHCPFWSHREGGGGVRTQGQTYDQNYNLLFKGPTPYHMQGISKRHVARLSLGRTYLPGLMGISQTYQLKTSSSPNHSRSQTVVHPT